MKYFSSAISLSLLGILSIVAPVKSQTIRTDGTTDTQLTPTENGIRIDNGNKAGGNVFHSFEEFSIPTGGEAFFNNDLSINNIFNRVTGGSISNIDGLIRANGNANIFLMNPNGIIFGENAKLDIGGSFLGTTADSIIFPDGEFSATDFDNPPLITINAPIGLNLRDNPGEIIVNGDGLGTRIDKNIPDNNALEVTENNTFSLIGGNIKFVGGTIRTLGGRIEIGSVGENQKVNLIPVDKGWQVDYENVTNFGDINLSDTANIDASGNVNGDIRVYGKNLTLTEGSRIESSVTGDELTSATPGKIIVNTSDSITLDGVEKFEEIPGAIQSVVTRGSQGNAGEIKITTGSLQLLNSSRISTTSLAIGNAGKIDIKANNIVLSNDRDTITTRIVSVVLDNESVGNAGNITIDTNSLSLSDRSIINTSNNSTGNAGSITIKAADNINLDGGRIINNVSSNLQGKPGEVNITTNSFIAKNNSQINANTNNIGNAGNINITANNISFDEGGIFARVDKGATGNSGNIKIEADSFEGTNGMRIAANNNGIGNAGNISVKSNNIFFDGKDAGIFNRVQNNRDNNGEVTKLGNISIDTNNLLLDNGARITTGSFGTANAGNINISATGDLSIKGEEININGEKTGADSAIFSRIEIKGDGKAGDINITTRSLFLEGGGKITASNQNKGEAGSIKITATDIISLEGENSIGFNSGVFSRVNQGAEGDSGTINITTNKLRVTDGAQITTNNFGTGKAGIITIDASELIELSGTGKPEISTAFFPEEEASGIYSSSFDSSGDSGTININTQDLVIKNDATVNVGTIPNNKNLKAGTGEAGDINVIANSINLNKGTIEAITQSGDGGNIVLDVSENIILRNNSQISARAIEEANGGNLKIDTDFIIALPTNNDILASAKKGQGGNININAEKGVLGIFERGSISDSTNDINATGEQSGIDGNVTINVPDVSTIQDLATLDTNVIDRQTTLSESCNSDRYSEEKQNRLTINQLSGKPYNPNEPIAENDIITVPDNIDRISSPQNYEPIVINNIVAARGMVKNPDGSISLVAYPTSNNNPRTPQNNFNCHSK